MTNHITTCIRGKNNSWTLAHYLTFCNESAKNKNTISFEHYEQSFFEPDINKRETITEHIRRLPEPLCAECVTIANEILGVD